MKIRKPMRQGVSNNHHDVLDDIYKATRGNLTFGTGPNNLINKNDQSQNIAGAWALVTAPVAPNTEFAVTHNLGKIPTGFDVKNKTAACDVYAGTTAWTTTQIFIKATVASVSLTLFILG